MSSSLEFDKDASHLWWDLDEINEHLSGHWHWLSEVEVSVKACEFDTGQTLFGKMS